MLIVIKERGGRKFLITGPPGVGKTTLVNKVADRIKDLRPVGFYTQEVRERGIRLGFRIISLNGGEAMLAHVKHEGSHRIGKYGVDVELFERFLANIPWERDGGVPVIIDEIGKMECLSAEFRALIDRFMGSDRVLLATIALRGDAYIEGLKRHRGVVLHLIDRKNREGMIDRLEVEIRGALAAG